ncbi:hypothetical protein NEOLEDRAFT_1135781 [Neolentinus lepideus HHB14362 ss-1]|uniref:Uncharacterized protein n=1 Tax=Neolentinus lepideus HHB14362 ss-1 TaxID=1314782 RepID=A0A165RKS0_9AGAM|nr:hypothetical protein NEOLEDRAFT_1135781 [Neolentinus lepideus HHB14362 ss-1]
MARSIVALLFAAVVGYNLLALAGAQSTSLYIPALGGDGPLSVSEVGVGSDGRTTWAVGPGAASGTITPSLPGTATLVEGPGDAYLTYALGNVGGAAISCAISGSQAECAESLTQLGSTVVVTTIVSVSPEVVAIASSGSASASASARTTASSSGSASSATSTSPSSRSTASSSSPSQTSSTAPATSATGTSGASSVKRVSAGAMGVIVLGLFFCLL